MKLKIRRHYPGMPLPARSHPSDAGLDLTAMDAAPLRGGVWAFDTGVSVEAEPGYYCEVVPRSSMVKTDFLMANSVGVIDPDYRGPIRVVLRYLGAAGDGGRAAAQALVGRRIAQLLVRRVEPVEVEACDALGDSPRGVGGFGSSGH